MLVWLLQHIATCCNMLQHAAKCCNTLQHATTCCNRRDEPCGQECSCDSGNTLQHATTCCYTQQHAAADVTSHAGMIARVIYTHTHTHICHYLIIRGQRPLRGHRSALIFIRGENISATLICTKDLQKQKIWYLPILLCFEKKSALHSLVLYTCLWQNIANWQIPNLFL